MRTRYGPVDHDAKDAALALWWVNLLITHQDLFDDDIIQLALLWNRPGSLYRLGEDHVRIPFSREIPILALEYIGDPNNRVESLARIQRTFQVLLGDLQVDISVTCSDGKPGGRYEGMGKIGTHSVWICLEVPWRPDGCKVVYVEPDEPWRRSLGHYHVQCERSL